MTLDRFLTPSLRLGIALAVAATALDGCSTVKSISPFGSNVPYAQDIQPTIPRPAVSEIPAFKVTPKPPAPAPKPEPPAPPSPPPAAAPAESAPSAPAVPAVPATPATPAAPPAPKSSATEAPAPKVASAEASPPAAPEPAPVPADKSEPAATAEPGGKGEGPSIPEEHRVFKDDGTYPNLAQVPARPVNMPTFAEAAKLEKSLVADRDKAKDASPDSPATPAVDSAPVPVPVAEGKTAIPQTQTKIAAVAPRVEDGSPCLSAAAASAAPTATVHFDPGSSSLNVANLSNLAEAIPAMRASKGTIRIFGHGDTETNAPVGAARFDLAAARAGAVAQAVAGYGIPVPRIAVGVACNDAALSGASVQLYAES